MTVAALASSISYSENGVTTSFAVPFRFFAPNHIQAARTDSDGVVSILAYGPDYTVTGGETDGGGTLTVAAAAPAGVTLSIWRKTPAAQETEYDISDTFPAKSHEAALDRATLLCQENADDIGRAVTAPRGETGFELPIAARRAAKFLGFGSDGGPLALEGTQDLPLRLDLASTAEGKGASLVALSDGNSVENAMPARAVTVQTRALLKALPIIQLCAHLTESGREGLFVLKAGIPPADPLEGIYIVSNIGGYYWERAWDGINAKPEWFGAIANSASGAIPTGNLAALHACLALCPTTNFAPKDYWISSTFKIDVQYRRVRGSILSDGYNTGTGTRILCTDTSKDVIQVGPDASPGSTSAFYRNIVVENLCARWAAALTPPGAGSESSAVKAWKVQYVLNCHIANCAAWEPIVGFYFYGAVYTKVDDCTVFRSATFGGPNDFFRAFWPQGVPAILAGGNPSLYLTRCNVSMGGAPALVDPTGIYINGDFSDLFIDDFESSAVPNGIVVTGAGGASAAGKLDLHIRNVVMDQCNGNGIAINAINALGMVTITGGYVQLNDTGASKCGIIINGSLNAGTVSIGGGLQLLSGPGTSNTGVYLSQQSNVKIDSTVIIKDFFRPVTIDGGSVNCQIDATIDNPNTGNATSAAVFINGGERIGIGCSVDGKASAFAQGVYSVGTGLNRSKIDPTLFDPAAINAGAVNKVQINGIQITTPGYYTTAGAAGSSGQGVFVTGITG